MEIYFKDATSMEAFKKIATQEILDNVQMAVLVAANTVMVATPMQDDDDKVGGEGVGGDKVVTPAAPASPAEPLSTDNEADIKKVMAEMRMCWQDAWTYIRCMELEEGASICCSEECEDHTSAIEELVYSAQIGKAKRNARRRAMGRPTSDDEDEVPKAYVAPPRVRDAERYWPYARCKNIVQEIMGPTKTIPRSHAELLTYIASIKRVSLETLKNTSPFAYFKGDARVAKTLGHLSSKSYLYGL